MCIGLTCHMSQEPTLTLSSNCFLWWDSGTELKATSCETAEHHGKLASILHVHVYKLPHVSLPGPGHVHAVSQEVTTILAAPPSITQ